MAQAFELELDNVLAPLAYISTCISNAMDDEGKLEGHKSRRQLTGLQMFKLGQTVIRPAN